MISLIQRIFKKIKENRIKNHLNNISFLKKMGYFGYNININHSKEEHVIRLAKGEFEVWHGITIKEFFDIYNYIIINNPEKLL